MDRTCPRCGAEYSVGAQHIGRQIVCKKCGVSLVIQADGIRLADESAVSARSPAASITPEAPESAPAQPSGPSVSESPVADFKSAVAGLRSSSIRIADPGLAAFTAGVVLLVLAYMMAIIDQAALARARAKEDLIDLQFRRKNETLFKGLDEAKRAALEAKKAYEDTGAARGGATNPAEDSYRQAVDVYDKKRHDIELERALFGVERTRQAQDSIDEQAADASMNRYWYSWLQLPGFVCLFLGCISFLGSESIVKRITGSALLTISLVVLVLLYLIPGTLQVQGIGTPPSMRRMVDRLDQDFFDEELRALPRRTIP